jgi:hypothetical protein
VYSPVTLSAVNAGRKRFRYEIFGPLASADDKDGNDDNSSNTRWLPGSKAAQVHPHKRRKQAKKQKADNFKDLEMVNFSLSDEETARGSPGSPGFGGGSQVMRPRRSRAKKAGTSRVHKGDWGEDF